MICGFNSSPVKKEVNMKKFSMARNMAVVSLFGLALFTACGDDSSSAPENVDPAIKELVNNYLWLDMIYIYGHERNELAESVEAYAGKGTEADAVDKFGLPSCTEAYYDVCHMYNQMKDPYTRYYDPSHAPEMLEWLMNPPVETVFLGAEYALYDSEKDLFEVVEASEDAKEDELHVGDLFYGDDVRPVVADVGSDTVEVSFKVTRGTGEDATEVMVKARATKAKQPTVRLRYEKTESGDSIPVIRITEFDRQTVGNGGTYEEFAEALEKTKKFKSVILDFRDNGGGDTDHCNATTAEFLNKGDTITIDIGTDGTFGLKDGEYKYYQVIDTAIVTAPEDGSAKDRYVVMLANEGSASCAELMISAIAVYKKAPIVGKLTYGKQIGQMYFFRTEDFEDTFEDPDDPFMKIWPEGLAVITQLYAYDKNWNQFQDVGIVPDYDITDRREQMKKAVELAAEATELRTAGYGTERLGHFTKATKLPGEGLQPKNLKMRYKFYKR